MIDDIKMLRGEFKNFCRINHGTTRNWEFNLHLLKFQCTKLSFYVSSVPIVLINEIYENYIYSNLEREKNTIGSDAFNLTETIINFQFDKMR